MKDKLLHAISSIINRSSAKNPKEQLERATKEMNENIPKMNRDIVLIKDEIRNLVVECEKISEEEHTLTSRKESVEKSGQADILSSIEEKLLFIKSLKKKKNELLKETENAYCRALDIMKKYINNKRDDIQKLLLLIKDNERYEWQNKFMNIMKRFSIQHDQGTAIFNFNDKEGASVTCLESENINDFLQKKISEGFDKIKNLRTISSALDEEVKKNIDRIIHLSENILEDLRKRPGDISKARGFLSYYLDAVVDVIEGYVNLSVQQVRSEEMIKSMQRAESLLDTIRMAFERILGKMMEYDVLNLDAEMEVLEKALKMDMF